MNKKYESQNRGNIKYKQENYYQLSLRYRKDDLTIPMLECAVIKTNTNKTEYIKTALHNQFKADGITPEMAIAMEPSQRKYPTPSVVKAYFIYKAYICEIGAFYIDGELIDEEKEICTTTKLDEARILIDRRKSRIAKDELQNYKFIIRGWEVQARNKVEAYENNKDKEFYSEPNFYEEVK